MIKKAQVFSSMEEWEKSMFPISANNNWFNKIKNNPKLLGAMMANKNTEDLKLNFFMSKEKAVIK
jgi:hypothetical protein